MLLAVGNIALNLLMDSSLRWFWLAFNVALFCLEAVVYKYAVIGLLWRKAQDEAEAQERMVDEKFLVMMQEYRRGR